MDKVMTDSEDSFQRGIEALNRLTALLAEETRLIATGQIEAGLALAAEKASAADVVAVLVASLKAVPGSNVPQASMEMLRQQIEAMQETMAANLAVLATARTVSENLLRDVARRLAPAAPNAYGPGHRRGRAAGSPLLISRAT
jgi:hypothetical protein